MKFKYANSNTIQCMGHNISLKSERNNPWLNPWFNVLLHTQFFVCATVKGQCLDYLGYITLAQSCNFQNIWFMRRYNPILIERNFIRCTVRPWDARFLGNEETHAAQIRATFVTL